MRSRFPSWIPWAVALVLLVPAGLAVVPPSGIAGGVGASGVVSVSPAESGSPIGASVPVAPAFLPSSGTVPLGPLPPTTDLTVEVGLGLSDAAGLTTYVHSLYAPGAHAGFLTPSVLAQQFGPSTATIAAAVQYFQSYGLAVTVAPNDLLISASGPSSEVARAFGTTFEQYRGAEGQVFFDHPTPAVLPPALDVDGAFGLGNVTPLLPDVASAPPPARASGPAAGCTYGPAGLAPCQVANAYDFASLVGNGTNGSGERIGIVDAYDGSDPQSQLARDFATFASEFALPTRNVDYAYPIPTSADLNLSGSNSGWGLEESLDLEWARASAPGASVTMTFAPDPGPGLIGAVNWLVANDAVNAISLSWGEPISGVYNAFSSSCPYACNASTDGTLAILGPVFEAAAAEGISVFAATGDCGSADGTSGQAVNYPAADPWVSAVGGTLLALASSNGAYGSETAWSGNVSGATAPGCANQGGSGGGFAPLPRPAWQSSLPARPAGRGIPDVSLDAELPVSVVYEDSNASVIGTSVATPIWAGITTIADQKAGTALGFLDPSLYRIYAGSNYSRDFHDVTTGTNGYAAGIGWDPVTGLGTPIVAPLVGDLSAGRAVLTTRPTTFLYAAPRFGPAPLTVSFAVNVSGGTGTYPVEEVQFGDGNSSAISGTTDHTFPRPGVYAAEAFVTDSSGNVSESPPIAVVVGGGTALNVSLSATTRSAAVGAGLTFAVGAAGGTGTISYNLTFGDGTYLNNQTGPTVVHAYGTPGGYCAEAVARDSATPLDGGASSRVAISVGGAPYPDCGNDTTPLVLTPTPGPQIRDASVEFVDLFNRSGGAEGAGLSGSLQLRAADPYVEACGCGIFRAPGNYSVTGWYNDSVNQEGKATTHVTVAPALVSTFAAGPLSGVAPLTVHFSIESTGGYLTDVGATNWSFGNGEYALGPTVSETYPSPGEYLAIGHLEDRGHGNSSEAFLVDVRGPSSGYGLSATIAPAADVTSGTNVRFSATVTVPGGAAAALTSWDLGDGFSAASTGSNETYYGPLPASDANVLHGSLSAVLPNNQLLANVSWSLPSFFALEGGVVPRSQALTLASGISPSTGRVPLTTMGSASAAGPGHPSIEWFWGDQGTSFGSEVYHSYNAGTFTATAGATNALGDSAYEDFAVRAYGPLTVVGGPAPSAGPAPLSVNFSVLGTGGSGPPYTYTWSFGDGSTGSGASVVHVYNTQGTYLANVTVADGGGLNVRTSWTVTVGESVASYPLGLLLGLAAAVGGAAGVIALVGTRPRRRPPPVPPAATL